jgi:diguanylate cyclase (GGDEF)-like protein
MAKRERSGGVESAALAAARGFSEGEAALVEVLRDLERETLRAADDYWAVVRSLAAALEARDGYTGDHSDAVERLALGVGRALGLADGQLDESRIVALLHDVGKIGVPDAILHKPGALTAEELTIMRRHPLIGESILRPLPPFAAVARAVRHEHEHWDGSGYPDGLAGEDIPIASRVVLACDAYNAMVSDRPYRPALTKAQAVAELRRCAATQFDPAVVAALVDCLGAETDEDQDGHVVPPVVSDHGDERGPRSEAELRALITVAGAVAGAYRLDDVIEIAAEQARRALGAGSLSISAWDASKQVLRTLINVGDLAEGEVRRPLDETYTLEGYPSLRALIEGRRPHLVRRDDPTCDPAEVELLRKLGKGSSAAVPIVFADRMWGELYATRPIEAPRLGPRDVRFLEAISGQVAAAIGRAELYSHMVELALEDPLTGLANRRALDERIDVAVPEALAAGRDLSLIVCDVDDLKAINDSHGHEAGDEALVRVGETLARVVEGVPGSLVSRVSGDEFCVLLEGLDADGARQLATRALDTLGSSGSPQVSMSVGIASLGLGARRPGDLFRAADAAQYTAKRCGRRRVFVAEGDSATGWDDRREARQETARAPASNQDGLAAEAFRRCATALRGRLADAPTLDRLDGVLSIVSDAFDVSARALSFTRAGSPLIDTLEAVDARAERAGGERYGGPAEPYGVDDFPRTAALFSGRGGSFILGAGDADPEDPERELLDRWGFDAVLVLATPDAAGWWLVELYADGSTRDLAELEVPLSLILAAAVQEPRPAHLAEATDADVASAAS